MSAHEGMDSSRRSVESCGERERSFGSADGDNLIFHRLAHHFQDARTKFGELIQEQNAAMGKRDLARLGNIATSD